ncbi:MAG TPA: glycosyltransferase 87 family protein [Candidatus Limnocylindrales bacterium]|nr:glycosyltransferase 87 family protein [Candidatus Limnocylindrales bacterium]
MPAALAPVAIAGPVVLAGAAWLLGLRLGHARWLPLAVLGIAVLGIIAALILPGLLADVTRTRARLELDSAAAGVVAVGIVIGHVRGRRPSSLDLLVGIALVAMVITDLAIVHSVYQRDLNLYLDAGHDFLAGRPVYAQVPLTVAPADLTQLPFVYPPVTLPLFAALAALPQPLVSVFWLVLQLLAAFAAIRLVGVPSRWAGVLLLWPPFVQGVWVGNVAIWMVLIFALVPFRRFVVGLPAMFKFQAGVAGLWLIRERDWNALGGAIGLVIALVLITLPLVGIGAWSNWYHGLLAFQRTTVNIPGIRGLALSRWIGELLALTLAVAIAGISLWAGRRASLANLGLAGVAVSPTLYLHGLTLALPGFLQLRAAVFWLLLIGTFSTGLKGWLWLILLVAALAPVIPQLRHQPSEAESDWQPLGRSDGPWPAS